jgi:hypothetical protein
VLSVGIAQLFCPRESDLLIAGIDLSRKILRLRGQIEDAGAGRFGESEVRFVRVALVGILRDFAGRFVVRVSVSP